MKSVLSAKHFHSEQSAYEFIEARLWANGRVCPHCGTVGDSGKLKGKSTRIGVYKCYECRKPFTVKVGTIFEDSHIKLHIWLQAIFLISSSKKGISSNQLSRVLGITLKSAWFLSHRIREAMKNEPIAPMGGNGGFVEVDETFIGNTGRNHKGVRNYWDKEKVLSLVDRTTGEARSFHIDYINANEILEIAYKNIDQDSVYMTDEAKYHKSIGVDFKEHKTVNHARKEYVRGEATTNSIEGFFSIFKRGMKGTYQHCQRQHLQRYLNEFDFRYTNRQALGYNDEERAQKILMGVVGKRLTYETTKDEKAPQA